MSNIYKSGHKGRVIDQAVKDTASLKERMGQAETNIQNLDIYKADKNVVPKSITDLEPDASLVYEGVDEPSTKYSIWVCPVDDTCAILKVKTKDGAWVDVMQGYMEQITQEIYSYVDAKVGEDEKAEPTNLAIIKVYEDEDGNIVCDESITCDYLTTEFKSGKSIIIQLYQDSEFAILKDTYYLNYVSFTRFQFTNINEDISSVLTVDYIQDTTKGTWTLATTNLATKTTTLAGYGITDAYTRDEVETLVVLNVDDLRSDLELHINSARKQISDIEAALDETKEEVDEQVSDVSDTVVGIRSDLEGHIRYARELRGDLENLTTTDKSSLVAAINEIDGNKADILYVDEQIGDIETALDGIIAIQNQLMGVSE